MLILSRKEDESVIIGDNIKIKVVSVDKGSVKIGFEAPDNMLILREELRDAVLVENKKATNQADIKDLRELHSKIKNSK